MNHETLRSRLLDIQSSSLTLSEKSKAMQECLSANMPRPKPKESLDFGSASYHPSKSLGCDHYQRSCKIKTSCCSNFYVCRFCHDEHQNHAMDRQSTSEMVCMLCQTIQPTGQACTTCHASMASYYCSVCKLWDNDAQKSIYHCDKCGICRVGQGLGIDYFHCDTCGVCMALSLLSNHKCIERNLESDCPICGEYMFDSTDTVIFMPCGHSIHQKCHQEYVKSSYQCPVCFKSLSNMSDYFKRIDEMLAQHTMPDEYSDMICHVYCNDCEVKSNVKYHFLYHKCQNCKGYNTKVLNTVSPSL